MSGIPWGIVLALLQQTPPAPAAPASLRELVAKSELIAWVRVEDVRAIDLGDSLLLRYLWPHGDAPYASLEVESVVHGEGDPSSLLVFAGDVATQGGGSALGVGERALVFFERDSSLGWHLSRCDTPWVEEFVGGRSPWAIRPGGLWRVQADGERLLRPPLAPPCAGTTGNEVDRAAFLEELDLALDLELPRFEARLISTGPTPFRVAIAADGILRGSREGDVDRSALAALWQAVEQERFHELPSLVGASGGPCSSAMDLCLVTRRSRHSVGIALGAIDELPEGELREATARALRIWEAVPIRDRPVLR